MPRDYLSARAIGPPAAAPPLISTTPFQEADMLQFMDPSSVKDIPSIGSMLAAGARDTPDRVFASFENELAWSWSDALAQAQAGAALLETCGVKPGDRVAIFAGNGPEFLKAWWGCALIGAVIAPLNTAYRGRVLADLLAKTDPVLLIVDEDRRRLLGEIEASVRVVTTTQVREATGAPSATHEYDFSAPHSVIFTSGTTGPSKGSVGAFPHLFAAGSWIIDAAHLTDADVFLVDMPMFHFSGLTPLLATMFVGGRIVVRPQPSMTSYWQVARDAGVTFSIVAGTMVEFLMHQSESPDDRNHAFRFMVAAPLPRDTAAFLDRFGIGGLISTYGASEVNLVICQGLDLPIRAGSCGKVRSGYQVRLVDERDIPVPVGSIGEAIVRADTPWIMSTHYLGEPEATARAWRNGWFHTGDLMSQDEDGYFYFRDRSKDSLRRRGENISSMEVEREVRHYPGVADVACVPFPSEIPGDDDVKVFIICDSGATIVFGDMMAFLVQNMPHFMVPRYYELIDAFPRTATHRVQKHELRARGNGMRTWDAKANGYNVTRRGLMIDDAPHAATQIALTGSAGAAAHRSVPSTRPMEHEIMAQEPYATEEALALVGKTSRRTSYPVSERQIREYLAGGDNWNPRYHDATAAETIAAGGIVAPPTFFLVATRRVVPMSQLLEDGQYCDLTVPGVHGRSVLASWEIEILAPVRIGDMLTVDTKILSIEEKKGRSGKLIVIAQEARHMNQDDVTVGIDVQTIIYM